ncbi:MAG: amidohydrolase [Oscillospiraceae bacterium]|nr:amidohydrolase [Oscillospiraceae bacterium]
MIDNKKLFAAVDSVADVIARVNDEVWQAAEVYFKEYKSAQALAKAAEEFGFETEMGVSGIPTAFVSKWGTKGPKIGILAEYDALDALSQKQGVAEKMPADGRVEGEPGHGCGHNSLGAGALGACIGLKKYCEENGVDAQIYFFGCPGEENGSGKVFMARDGLFDDMDICLTWHPGDTNNITGVGSLANISIKYKFHGVASHAAATPHLGRSALDACELMNVGVNYLREHIIPEARIHYSYLDAGGKAPNVVQDYACTYYFVRAPKAKTAFEITDRVDDIARGAALMTGTQLEIIHMDGLSDYIPNETLGNLMYEAFCEVGTPEYTEEELAMAKAFTDSIDPKALEMGRALAAKDNNLPVSAYEGVYLDKNIAPYKHLPEKAMPGSTDVGDVSYCAPTAQFNGATIVVGTPSHSWQMTGQGAVSYCHKGTVNAAKVLALTALKAIDNPEIIAKAKAEHKLNCPDGYICPTDPDFMPDLE